MKLLVIHGPNVNLIGLWSSKNNLNITLDKVNRHIRKYIRDKDLQTKIIQSHNETNVVSYIQNNRKNIDIIESFERIGENPPNINSFWIFAFQWSSSEF